MAAQRTEQLIDLAPHHKLGLVAGNPVLLGAGAIGYGEAIPRGLNLAKLGAAVVGPLLGSSRGGAPPPRLAHVNGGIVLATGLQNRGVQNAIQQYGKLWGKLGCPVIVQVAESHSATAAKIAARLAAVPGVQGLELLPAADLDPGGVAALVRAVERGCELPIWVKLLPARAAALAPAAVGAGAVAVVIGQSPTGVATRLGSHQTAHRVHGALWGPLVFPQVLESLLQVVHLQLPAALIAGGGIHTEGQVREALAAGAQAVQIDSAVWVEPGLPERLAARLAGSADPDAHS